MPNFIIQGKKPQDLGDKEIRDKLGCERKESHRVITRGLVIKRVFLETWAWLNADGEKPIERKKLKLKKNSTNFSK